MTIDEFKRTIVESAREALSEKPRRKEPTKAPENKSAFTDLGQAFNDSLRPLPGLIDSMLRVDQAIKSADERSWDRFFVGLAQKAEENDPYTSLQELMADSNSWPEPLSDEVRSLLKRLRDIVDEILSRGQAEKSEREDNGSWDSIFMPRKYQ